MVKEAFIVLTGNFSSDSELINELWMEIKVSYSNKKRHYHDLHHLENLLSQLAEVRNQIKQWNAVLFALFYHDIIYNTLKSNNEEKSAIVAEQRMKQLSVPAAETETCKAIILATKTHLTNANNDINFFTDADLSILGQDWTTYSDYYKGIRKEYSIYPDIVYNPGRRKVLQHFLQMERIFKTDHFFNKFELRAKENIRKEMAQLS